MRQHRQMHSISNCPVTVKLSNDNSWSHANDLDKTIIWSTPQPIFVTSAGTWTFNTHT